MSLDHNFSCINDISVSNYLCDEHRYGSTDSIDLDNVEEYETHIIFLNSKQQKEKQIVKC